MKKIINIVLIISLLAPVASFAQSAVSNATPTTAKKDEKRDFCDRLVKKEEELQGKEDKKADRAEEKENKKEKGLEKQFPGNETVKKAVEERNAAFRAAREKRNTTIRMAFEQAKADCVANKDPQLVKKSFKEARRTARETFKKEMRAAREKFKSVIQQFAKGKNKDNRGRARGN